MAPHVGFDVLESFARGRAMNDVIIVANFVSRKAANDASYDVNYVTHRVTLKVPLTTYKTLNSRDFAGNLNFVQVPRPHHA